ILSVARFSDPRKNVRMLFYAYHLLKQHRPNAPRLVLAGSTGPADADWAIARDLRIIGNIEYRPNLSPEGLAELYRAASLFVLPSDEEGFGMALVEAMACGVPVISTRCGGPETIVTEGETGHLTPVNDPRGMADRLHQLIQNPEKRALMGSRARDIVDIRFSLEATGRAYLDVYDRLLA